MKSLLCHVFTWANRNEMTFGINKCATMVIKPLNFVQSRSYETPTFYLGMYSITKVSCYTYFGIPFSDDLSLQPVITNIQSKVRKSLFSFSNLIFVYWLIS